MTNLFRSFYSRLSLLFLVLIFGLAAASLAIAFNAAGHLFDDVEQQLNRKYAASLAVELQPFVTGEIETEKIKETIHYMMVLNPMVEIYLIDREGRVLAYFTGPDEMVKRHQIDMAPVRTFIYSDGSETVKGDDPRTEDEVKPFSAAPMRIAGNQGYVYVILRGKNYDRSLQMIRNSYYIRSGLLTFLLAIGATLISGLALFSLLTSRLRKLGRAVREFERGDFGRRVDVRGDDEIAALSRTFNEMADSVEKEKQQRNDLVSNISHDLRSPLTSIRGHIETVLIKDGSLPPEKRKEYLEASLKSISAFQKLVEQLFELTRLENGETAALFEPFYPAELAQDTIVKLKPQAENKGIDLRIELCGQNTPLRGDIALIERLLNNILENALFHTDRGGVVSMTLREDENRLIIEIADTGEGIPEKELPRIFERFYRADKSRDRRRAGTGLGLAISREIVEMHKGTISVSSSEGSGTTFTITLPL